MASFPEQRDDYIDRWGCSYGDFIAGSMAGEISYTSSNLEIYYGDTYNGIRRLLSISLVPIPFVVPGVVGPPGPPGPPGPTGDTGATGNGITNITQPSGNSTMQVNYTNGGSDTVNLPDPIWESGTGSKIYYNAGYVGIGLTNPLYPLHISGEVKSTNQTAVSTTSDHTATSLFTNAVVKSTLTGDDIGTFVDERTFSAKIIDDGTTITNATLYYGDYEQAGLYDNITHRYGIYLANTTSNYLSGLTIVDSGTTYRQGIAMNPNAYGDLPWGNDSGTLPPAFIPKPSYPYSTERFAPSNYTFAVNGNSIFNGGLYPMKDAYSGGGPNSSLNRGYDLGGPNQRWGSLYISQNTIYMGDAIISYDCNTGGFNFLNANGTDEVDLSTKYLYTERLGIGSNPPEPTYQELHVIGTAYITSNIGIGITHPTQAVDVYGNVKADYFLGDGSLLTNLPSSPWNISGTNLYYTVGNIGIGTTLPQTSLDVVGTTQSTYFIGDGSQLTNLPISMNWNLANSNLDIAPNHVWLVNDTATLMRLPMDLYVDEDILISGSLTQNADTTLYKTGSYRQVNPYWTTSTQPNTYLTDKTILVDGNVYIKRSLAVGCNLSSYQIANPVEFASWCNVSEGIRTNQSLIIKNNMIVKGNIYQYYDTTTQPIRDIALYQKIGSRNIADGSVEYRHLQSTFLRNVAPISSPNGTDLTIAGNITNAGNITSSALTGMIAYFGGSNAPIGWLICDGATYLRTTYPNLFAAIGTIYGSTTSLNFKVPDLRGEFLRGWDAGRGIDTGRVFASFQDHQFQDHQHGTAIKGDVPAGGTADCYRVGDGNTLTGGAKTGNRGAETRPRNIAILACIKY